MKNTLIDLQQYTEHYGQSVFAFRYTILNPLYHTTHFLFISLQSVLFESIHVPIFSYFNLKETKNKIKLNANVKEKTFKRRMLRFSDAIILIALLCCGQDAII